MLTEGACQFSGLPIFICWVYVNLDILPSYLRNSFKTDTFFQDTSKDIITRNDRYRFMNEGPFSDNAWILRADAKFLEFEP